MSASSLALAAKRVIDAAWLQGDAYDLSSQAAFALESAQLLQSPETAAELEQLRNDITGACLARWEEEQDNARLRLALESAKRGRREARGLLEITEDSRKRWRDAEIESAKELKALRARVAELEQQREADHKTWQHDLRTARGESEAATARIAETEAANAEAVAVSETLSRALHDEMLAASALYAALTMPTTPEQRQAALDRFTAVAERIGSKHAPAGSGGA